MSAEHTPATTPQPTDVCGKCGRAENGNVDLFTPTTYWQSRAVKAEAELADERAKGRIEWETLQMKRDEEFKKLEAEVERLKKLLAEARSCIFEYPATIDVIEKIDNTLSRR